MKRYHAAVAALLIALMAALLLKEQPAALPAVPEQTEPGTFDTRAAFARLQRILGDQRPHPVDSAANDAVRQRLLAELRALGLQPQVTDDLACSSTRRGRTVYCARVRNVVATIGPAAGRHLLLVSHYDSTVAGPGAADDGIGVATMLEVAARLRGRRLSRPVTFLFNEGEEAGLIGARAFLERHPIAGRVDTLLNFEARGVEGPAFMFETSRPNGPAVAAFSRAVERPAANSLMTDFYRMIPNSTDVAVFSERDWTILNFAIVGNETRYHSAGDELAALDLRSLRHMGDQALALTTTLAAGAAPAESGERLYMDLAGRALIVLPVGVGLALLGLALLILTVEGWRRRSGILPATGAVLTALVGSAALAWTAMATMRLLRSGEYWRAHPEAMGAAIGACALAACIIALVLARRAEPGSLRVAFWTTFTIVGGGIAAVAPGGVILFLFPPLAMAAALLAGRWSIAAERIGALFAAAILFLTFGPLLHNVGVLLDFDAGWMFAPLAALILFPLLAEAALLLRLPKRRALLAMTAILPVGAWTLVGLLPAYSEDRQQLFTIEYLWDADRRSGSWLVNNDFAPLPQPYPGHSSWRLVEVPHTPRRRWAARAPALPAAAPALQLIDERQVRGGRALSFRLSSGGAESVVVRAPAAAGLRALRSGGFVRPFGAGSGDQPYFIRCSGRSCDGLTFEVSAANPRPVEWTLIGTRSGLPQGGAALQAARPRFARPQYGADATIVVARARF